MAVRATAMQMQMLRAVGGGHEAMSLELPLACRTALTSAHAVLMAVRATAMQNANAQLERSAHLTALAPPFTLPYDMAQLERSAAAGRSSDSWDPFDHCSCYGHS